MAHAPIAHDSPSRTGPPAAVYARGLTKRFDDEVAVNGVDLTVPTGSIVGLIGPSGSGKTTTVRMLLGIVTPSEGVVEVFGKPPSQFTPAERARFGYMPQMSSLYPNLSIHENLHFAASIYGMSFKRRQRFAEVLDFVELSQHRNRLLRDASGGMQRRVALAAALLHDPQLLFLDEPTTGLDPVLRRKLWDHFEHLRSQGRTLLVTTQYVGESAYCDRVALIVDGHLLTMTTPDGMRREAFGGDFLDVVISRRADDALVSEITSLPQISGIEEMSPDGRKLRVLVDDAEDQAESIRRCMTGAGIDVLTLSHHQPSFDDAFVRLVSAKRPAA